MSDENRTTSIMEPPAEAPARLDTKADAPALVSLEHVDVDIEANRILEGVSWRLEPGTHWGVVGANGSGKSTFLALVAGTRWPVPGSGSRRYDFGRGPERDAVNARRLITLVGHELQDRYTKLDWNFRALDVVISGVHRTDIPRLSPARVDELEALELMRELDLASLAERPFLELSRGEQRRVLIARACAFRPRVLLLDEPASGLDGAARAALDELVARVAEHAQLLVAAHSSAALPGVVTHIVELEGGRIRRQSRIDAAEAEQRSASRAPRRGPPQVEPADRNALPLAELREASVYLGERRALDRVSFTIGPGQHWLVTGPNGAGKSTLLRLLHGQLRPARGGSLRWPGLGDPADVWTLRRRVGWVSPELQAGYVYRATVGECIGSGFASSLGLVRRLTADEQARVEELMAAFELAPFASRLLTSLSYGQLRRVLIARALAPRPRLLLLDEPWEGLDAETSALVADRLRAAQAAGTQLVCASHLGDFGLELDHELVLERGAVSACGPRAAPRADAGDERSESSASAQARD